MARQLVDRQAQHVRGLHPQHDVRAFGADLILVTQMMAQQLVMDQIGKVDLPAGRTGRQRLGAREGVDAPVELGDEFLNGIAMVCRAPRQRPHHAQRVADAMLQLPQQRPLLVAQSLEVVDIGRCAQPFDDRSVIAMDRTGAGLVPVIAILLRVADAEFDLEALPVGGQAPRGLRRFAIVGMDDAEPAIAYIIGLALASERLPLRACPQPCAIAVRAPDEQRQRGDEMVERLDRAGPARRHGHSPCAHLPRHRHRRS